MRRALLCAFLLFAFVALEAQGPELAGIYRCQGQNADGQSYDGYVQILPHDERYEVRWIFTDPGQNAQGIGLLVDGRLSVAYYGGTPGIVVYAITTDTLTGTWADPTSPGTHQETLTKLPKDHPIPTPEKPPPDRKGELKG